MNAMLTKSWKLVVATAVFCVATTSSPSYAATLTHRWTFNSDYKDAVGNADATLGGNGSVSLSNGKAVLAGGNGAGYLNLGAGVLGTGNAATLELWATNITEAANWAYLFTYGIHDTTPKNLITLCNRSSGLSYSRTTRNAMLEGDVNGSEFIKANEIMIGMPEGMAYHYSVTFRVNGANTDTRWMVRDAATGFLLAEYSVTIPNLTLAGAASAGWALTLGHNPFTNSSLDLNAGFDEVRVWDGVLGDEQLMANAIAGPDAPLGGSEEAVAVNAGETFTVPTTGGYGYKTDKSVTLGAGAKIRFDTTGYFCKGLRFKAGGIVVPSGNVLDYVELSDSANYEATMEDANTILVQLKSTIPYESTWSGGTPSTAADLANVANWTSVNAQGAAITAAPTAKTTVLLPAAALATFTLPSDFTPNWGRVVLGGRTATQSGRIAGTPNMNKLAYLYRGVSDYTSLGANGVGSINGNGSGVAFLKNNLVQSQVRFDGWVNVPADKAGRWFINCQFDDAVTLFIDGERVFHDPCWTPAVVGGCFVSEGWHRFTLIAADGGGGYGCHANDTVNGTRVPFRITVNGSLTAFHAFTFGTDGNTVTLAGDADWRALGEIELESGVTIDLNGHRLAVADIRRSMLGASVVNNASAPAILYVNSDPNASQAQASGMVSGLPIVQYGSKFFVWTGAAGDGRFTNAANWSPQPESFTAPENVFCFDSAAALVVTVDGDVTTGTLEFAGSGTVTLANPNAATTNTLTVTKIVNAATTSPVVNCAVQFADKYLVDCASASVNFAGGATATYPDPSTTDNAASHALTGVVNFTADWPGATYANPYTVPNGSTVYGKAISGTGSSMMLRVEAGGCAEFDTITYNRDWYRILGTLRSKGVVTYSGNTGNTADTGVFQALGFRKSGLTCYLRLSNYRVGAEGFYLYRDYSVYCYDVNPTFYADADFAFTGDYSSNPADWSFNINNRTVTFATEGHTVTYTANVTGNGTIRKVGEGVFVAKSQNANATAAVSVEGGTYVIANSFGMGTGAITVKSGATLKVAVAEATDVANAVTAEAGSTLEFKASGAAMMGALSNLTLPASGAVNILFDDSAAEGNTEYTLMDGLTEDDKAKLMLPSVEGLTFRFDGAALKVMKIARRSLTWTNAAHDHSFDTLANWTVEGSPATALPLGGDIVTLNVSDSTPISVTNRLYGLASVAVKGSGEASFAFSGRGGLTFGALDIAAGASARIPNTMGLADGALTGRGTLILDPGAGGIVTMTKNNGANAVPFDAEYFWGETVIASGTVKFGNIWSFGSRRDNSDNRQIPTVRVKGGATLDENALSTSDYNGETLRVILEEGATLKSTGNSSSGLTSLVLEGNATVDASSGKVVACYGYDCGSSPVSVSLGTNTLTKVGSGQFYLSACSFAGTGTLDVKQGEVRVRVDGWNYFPTSTLANGTLRVRSGATFTLEKRGDNPTHFTVKDLVLDGTIARTAADCVFTVTGTVTGSGTAAALALAQGATIKPGGVSFLTAGSISGAVTLDARDAVASATGESIPLFKVGGADALPAKGSLGFAGGIPEGWELVETGDGLGYELRARGFMIMVY